MKPVDVDNLPKTDRAGCGRNTGLTYLGKGECH